MNNSEEITFGKESNVIMVLFLQLIIMLSFISISEGANSASENAALFAIDGSKLSDKEAEQLNAQLATNPNNMLLRIKLLGYYDSKQFISESARKEHQKHVIWIIKNHPESAIAGLPYAQLNFLLENEAYNKAKGLWLKQVETYKENTIVIGNAANFFFASEMPIAEGLLQKAQAIEPDNPDWLERLGHLYMLGLGNMSGKERKEAAEESLRQLENGLNLTKKDVNRFYMLDDLAEIAFDANEFKKASYYAVELLNSAPKYKHNWNYGNAIHQANLILGRIALQSGNLEKAKEYLINAGKTPGSPQLNSFGPNMILAKELLEKGQREVVIEYLQLCATFWETGKENLRNWITTIQKGGSPDFGE